MNKAVLFDLDGTLIDTAPDFIIAVNELRDDHGLPPLSESAITEQVSNGAGELTKIALSINDEDPSFETSKEKLLTNYLKVIGKKSSLYPNLEDLIEKLKRNNIRWGIITNKPLFYTTALLKSLSIDKKYNVLICPDHVKNKKPDPEGILMALNYLDCEPSNAIYIGDHQRDIEAGRLAGVKTVCAAYGYIPKSENIKKWNADFTIDTSDNLKKMLEVFFCCKI
jgi:2-phosphoglycolate phosphatase